MTDFQIWTLVVSGIGTFLTAIGIVVTGIIGLSAQRANHERTRAQATIDYVAPIRAAWVKLKQHFEKTLEDNDYDEKLSDQNLDLIMGDPQLRNELSVFLSTLEHLAVGTDTKVFDKNLVLRMIGALLVHLFNWVEPYIERVQGDQARKTIYIEFKRLAIELKTKHLEEELKLTTEERKAMPADNRGKLRQ